MPIGIEREEGVAVHIGHITFRLQLNRTLLQKGNQFPQGLGADIGDEVIQLCFQVSNSRFDEGPPLFFATIPSKAGPARFLGSDREDDESNVEQNAKHDE
jgi:hypothetical protein